MIKKQMYRDELDKDEDECSTHNFDLILEAILSALVMMLCIYVVMVRYNMRQSRKLKPICCSRFGALGQMHDEADLYLELSCVGTDPRRDNIV